ACRAGEGACWGFIAEKHRFILFGTYPYELHWRPAIATVLLIGLWIFSAFRRFWKSWLALVWLAGLGVIGILMWGGVLGMRYVENERWGGLILTLLLTTFGLAIAFPLSILLALGRRSDMPVIRALCIGYIELIRGVPLISLLFMASVMLPLFLPSGVTIDKLLRAQIAMILFAAAYLAEVVRGGLQAIPRGQYDAAHALALPYWRRTYLIILPQALRISVPPLVNTFIAFFKDTSLVLIIGLFDLLSTIKISLQDRIWTGFGVEAYLFASLVYFAFCTAMSRYSRSFERK
ncbi:MAG: amino acid ABC transporter permease, partial [bacterium]